MASICLVAGDPSGDAHAARLITALKSIDPSLTFAALAGPATQHAGARLLDDLTQTTAIGPFDAARHVKHFLRARHRLQEHLKTQRPDLVILVDFGDFNVPIIAPLVKRYGIPIVYYISPQVWAWGRFRLRAIARLVDRMIVFFPFEETLYKEAGVPVTWVGHPLIDDVRPSMTKAQAIVQLGLNPWRRVVGLLPGSREDEVRRHLPLFIKAAARMSQRMPGLQFLVPKAPSIGTLVLEGYLSKAPVEVRIAATPIADALIAMDAAVVVSGTATLETALCEVPMAIVYRASWPTYLAAKAVIRVPSIGLVNIVAGRQIVPELIQHHATPGRIAETIVQLLRDDEQALTMRTELRGVRQKLGTPGAVQRAAGAIIEVLHQTAQRR